MSKIFFRLRNGNTILADPEAVEVAPDRIAIRALAEARSLIADEALQGLIDLRQRIDAEDEAGSILHSIAFANAVRIIPGD
jgi:hypothetical protein